MLSRWCHSPRSIVFIIFAVVGFVLGMKMLSGPDLGWHLAGGLWILENGKLPTRDPFGAGGHYWWCYSWLAETLFAVAYRAGGFYVLRLLQALLCVIFCMLTVALIYDSASLRNEGETRFELFLDVLAIGLILVFCGPIMYLRPQLLSLILFVLCLRWAEQDKLSMKRILIVGVLWANIHIFWVFLPLIVFCYGLKRNGDTWAIWLSRLLVSAISGFVTPYGWKVIEGMLVYLVGHESVYSSVYEAHPLSLSIGYIFWMFLGGALLLLLFSRSAIRHSRPLFILSSVFLVASLLQVRFIPFFGVLAGIHFRQLVLPLSLGQLKSRLFVEREAVSRNELMSNIRLGLAVLCLIFVSFMFVYTEPVLGVRQKATIRAAKRLSQKLSEMKVQGQVNVLNHFNDGGWLELGFWLSKDKRDKKSCCRVSIDGRTLVIGSKRFQEFQILETMGKGWCEIFKSWELKAAILPSKMPLSSYWTSGSQAALRKENCGRWVSIFMEDPFRVFLSQRVSH